MLPHQEEQFTQLVHIQMLLIQTLLIILQNMMVVLSTGKVLLNLIIQNSMLLMVVHQLYHYLRYMAGVLWEQLNTRKQLHSNEAIPTLPTISVIVCARNERDNLRDYLHTLLNQDYPCFEVIVVDDGSEDQTTMILEQYARQYTNFYRTFVPREARVISSKKLALTIGAKAAHNECLVLTDADCRPESRYWLREMASGFTGGKTEVVLGFSAYFEKEGLLNGLICYDTLFTG